jgi:hypothetical protein
MQGFLFSMINLAGRCDSTIRSHDVVRSRPSSSLAVRRRAINAVSDGDRSPSKATLRHLLFPGKDVCNLPDTWVSIIEARVQGVARNKAAFGVLCPKCVFDAVGDRVSERAEQYRVNAKKCLQLAQSFKDPETKRSLLDMANAWRVLAALSERTSKRQRLTTPRPATNESPPPPK